MGKRKAKSKKLKSKILASALILTIAILIFSLLSFALREYIDRSEYVEADVVRVVGTTVILGHNCTAIVAQTSEERARSIELGLKKKIEVRPNTHDIFVDVIKYYNITLESVTLDRFENNIYYATLHLSKNNLKLNLDSKPSDAIAIALRAKSPIYINKTLLRLHGKNIC